MGKLGGWELIAILVVVDVVQGKYQKKLLAAKKK